MPKKAGIVCVSLGAVLIISALLLFLYNQWEDDQAGKESENLLANVQSVISERTEETEPKETTQPIETIDTTVPTEPTETQSPEMTVIELDGYGYIGFLTIPSLEIELPVMSEWDYARLKLAPCRQSGSSKTDDLVIAAHNYKRHFGNLSQLSIGSLIYFTDMDGNVNTYAVAKMDTLDPEAVDVVLNSEFDLVLYTCTYGGKNRVTVFCDRITN